MHDQTTAQLVPLNYNGQAVRCVEIDGARWAVAADICAALEIKDPSHAVSRLDADDRIVLRRSDTPVSNGGIWEGFAPQVQQVGLVSQDGATDLVLESRKPNAREFRRWLTHEVWPSIRDTGSYSTAPALPMSEEEIVLHALTIQNRKIAQLTEKVRIDAPKVEAYDQFMEADGTYSFLATAKILGWGRNVMMRELRRLAILQGNNLPYQRYEHHFKVTPTTYVNRKTGETVPSATTTVRPSGVDFLRKKLAEVVL